MRTYIKTYGCTLNQADSDIMRSVLEGSGIQVQGSPSNADVTVINTCTVKKPTEQRVLQKIGDLYASGTRLVVAGCLASSSPELVRRRAPKASIVSTGSVHRIAQAVMETAEGRTVTYSGDYGTDKLGFFGARDSVIARVPVSEGCASDCSFCETRLARGRLNSFSEDLIVRAVENSVSAGAKEVQLTSQDMGAYGADRGTDIASLMSRISGIEGDFRVRIGMLNPDHLHRYVDRLVDALNSDARFYRFLHLPVQSGSDAVLESMGRRCTAGMFSELAGRLRREVKGIAIETDIIVGYPGETDEDFARTLELVARIRPDVTNISRFGAMRHTRAAGMRQLGVDTIRRRSIELSRKVRELQGEINSKRIGERIGALMTERGRGSLNGRTDSYRQVVVQHPGGARLGSHMDLSVYAASCNVLYCSVI